LAVHQGHEVEAQLEERAAPTRHGLRHEGDRIGERGRRGVRPLVGGIRIAQRPGERGDVLGVDGGAARGGRAPDHVFRRGHESPLVKRWSSDRPTSSYGQRGSRLSRRARLWTDRDPTGITMSDQRFRGSGLGRFVLIASIVAPGSVLPLHAATTRPFVQKRFLRVISGGSVSVPFTKPNTAGNLIGAYVVWANAGPVSITDTAGNAYDSAIGPTQATGDPSNAQVFYARNIGGGPNTVTASFATGITARGVLYVHEYTGLDRTDPL